MNSIITYIRCPVCNSEKIFEVMDVKDYLVSQQLFSIWQCEQCTLRFTQNVPDENHIAPFYQHASYISHTETQEGLVNKLYHRVRRRTMLQKRKLVQSATALTSGTLVDIGAGTGAFAGFMASGGWHVNGFEPDENARQRAASAHDIQLQPAHALFNVNPASVDAVTMWHVLEHVHPLHQYLDHLQQIIKSNGRIFIAVPNYTSYDAAKYKSYWAAYDVPRHLYHFSPSSMIKLLDRHGLTCESIRPMWYDAFYISLVSERYKTGRERLLQGFSTGALSNIKTMFNNQKCSSLIYVIAKKA